jgi:hypothetical protein
MTDRFPRPWRIVDIPRGFDVEDATGLQLCVFCGRSGPNTAGHTCFLTIEEARQMVLDFAKLPKLLKRPPVVARLRKPRLGTNGPHACGPRRRTENTL